MRKVTRNEHDSADAFLRNRQRLCGEAFQRLRQLNLAKVSSGFKGTAASAARNLGQQHSRIVEQALRCTVYARPVVRVDTNAVYKKGYILDAHDVHARVRGINVETLLNLGLVDSQLAALTQAFMRLPLGPSKEGRIRDRHLSKAAAAHYDAGDAGAGIAASVGVIFTHPISGRRYRGVLMQRKERCGTMRFMPMIIASMPSLQRSRRMTLSMASFPL